MNKLRQSLTEFIGLFIMVFAGTSTIVINDLHGDVIIHMYIALFFWTGRCSRNRQFR